MASPQNIRWTNKSVLRLAGAEDPIAVIERRARELALRARDSGWSGPPFDPIMIADLLKIPVEANASVPDARIVSKDHRLIIQYNPTQPRARVRFTIAHEIAHTLFPDVAEEVRHRGGNRSSPDDWQLELLCNIAAAEFVMPLGSMPPTDKLPPIEELMIARKTFDVSAEAFLIRATRITSEPVIMFCASALETKADTESPRYRIDYTTSSRTAPMLPMRGGLVPKGSAVHSCTAIGYTDRKSEDWFSHKGVRVECVGTLEQKMLAKISSTFQGVGAASARKIMGRGGKSSPPVRLAEDVDILRPFIRRGQEILKDAYLRNSRVLLEGTQGTSLSMHHGIYPYVTSRDTTVAGCLADAGIADYPYSQRPQANRVAEIAIDHSVPNVSKYVTLTTTNGLSCWSENLAAHKMLLL